MADLKIPGRQIGQPSAPDISPAAEGLTGINSAVQMVAKTAGQYVKNTRDIEEKTLLAGATTEIERLQLKYASDPMLDMDKVNEFQKEASGITSGWLQGAHPAYSERVTKDLNATTEKLTTKLLGKSYDASLRREKTDIGLAINELQNSYVRNIQDGDIEQAAKNKQDLGSLVRGYYERGGSAKEINAISEQTESLGIAALYTAQLKRATDEASRINVMKKMEELPNTPANNKAFNMAYTEFKRLNSLYKQGLDLSQPYENVITGNSWKNRALESKPANELVSLIAKNIANNNQESALPLDSTPVYQALPAYEGQERTYDFNEDINAYREGREPRRYLANEVVQTMEATENRAADLFDLAQAHAMVGSKNATEFPTAVTDRLLAGNGALANEAVEALDYVYKIAPASLDLDTEAEIVYSEFKLAKANGNFNYEDMIVNARNKIAKISEGDIKLYNDLFNSQFGLSLGKGDELNKVFKNAIGVDALKTDSIESLKDFQSIFKTNYIASRGNMSTAIDTTKRQMVKIHGEDRFSATSEDLSPHITKPITSLFVSAPTLSSFQYVRFPPTKILSGLTTTQINNQLTEQLVFAAEKNPNIVIPEHYKKIQSASAAEKMEGSFTYPAPQWSAENIDPEPANYIAQEIPGVGRIEGRVFLKSNDFTIQNNLGVPVWEVWMQDINGNQYPVRDDTSPVNNTLLFIGQSAEQFAPEWAKQNNDEKISEAVNRVLTQEGRSVYPVFSMSPILNYEKRKAYRNDIENITRIQDKVKHILND